MGADDGAQVQGDEALGLLRLGGGEGQSQELGRRVKRVLEQAREDSFRDGFLVVGYGQAALGDVEDALGGAPVALGVVQHALFDAVGRDDVGDEFVAIGRDGEQAGEAVAVEHEGLAGEARGDGGVFQIVVEEVLDALVGRAEVVGKEAVFLVVERQQAGHEIGELAVDLQGKRRAAELTKLQINVIEKLFVRFRSCGGAEPGAAGEFRREATIHGKWISGTCGARCQAPERRRAGEAENAPETRAPAFRGHEG